MSEPLPQPTTLWASAHEGDNSVGISRSRAGPIRVFRNHLAAGSIGMGVARSGDVPSKWRFRSSADLRAGNIWPAAPCIHVAAVVTRMPSRPVAWGDLIRATCAVLAPYARRCALGLQIAFATGAVTVR